MSQPQGYSDAGRIGLIKNATDTIGNRTCDLPALSAVPQPTAPPRAPFPYCSFIYLLLNEALVYAAKRNGTGCGQRLSPWTYVT